MSEKELIAARKFVRENLHELCREVRYLHTEGQWPQNSKFAELRKITSFAGLSSMSVAEDLIRDYAILFVIDHPCGTTGAEEWR
jgi:hypothetical protein